jgi:16S rRNA (uracil1498-N3)-methyltransferase
MHSAYHSDFDSKTKTLVLSEEESKHVVKVLRHVEGDQIEICNGKGIRAIAHITLSHPKKCAIEIVTQKFEEAPKKIIHLAIAPTKNMDRLEWLVEKATEIGVDKITLLQCKNNERKVVKMERLEKIALAAMKQSQRFYLPKMAELVSFKEFINKHPKGGIAHCYDNDTSKVSIQDWEANGPLLIGPEGDFTLEEVNLARDKGYATIDLGKNRLRTETAGLLGVTILSFKQ